MLVLVLFALPVVLADDGEAFVGLAPNGSLVVKPMAGQEVLVDGVSFKALVDRLERLEYRMEEQQNTPFLVARWHGGVYFAANSNSMYCNPPAPVVDDLLTAGYVQYSHDTAAGDTWTILKPGVFNVLWNYGFGVTGFTMLTKNSPSVDGVGGDPNRMLRWQQHILDMHEGSLTWTGVLQRNDVIRLETAFIPRSPSSIAGNGAKSVTFTLIK